MKNSTYNPYVTERIHRFDNTLCGVCYSAPFMHCEQDADTLLNGHNIIALHNQLPDTPELIIIPLAGNSLMEFLRAPENYPMLQAAHVRLAIDYAGLLQGGAPLLAVAHHFSFWLCDLAPPGTEWKKIVAFPFSGVVLSGGFFNDNYLKFSFPFLIESLREREADVILRTAQLTLNSEHYQRLQLSGWQQQRTPGTLF